MMYHVLEMFVASMWLIRCVVNLECFQLQLTRLKDEGQDEQS